MKIRSLKRATEDVFLDGSTKPTHVLKEPTEDAYSAWQDARMAQVRWHADGKEVEHTKLNKVTRALLVGLCLHEVNGDGPKAEPVGEQFVRDNFTPASITEMHDWLNEVGDLVPQKDRDPKK